MSRGEPEREREGGEQRVGVGDGGVADGDLRKNPRVRAGSGPKDRRVIGRKE